MIVIVGGILGGCAVYVAAMSALGRFLAHCAADELAAPLYAPVPGETSAPGDVQPAAGRNVPKLQSPLRTSMTTPRP